VVDYLEIEFGENFIKARKRKGVDQKTAAAALDISAAFLSKVENDKQKPSIELIMNAAEYYRVKPGFFFESAEQLDINMLYERNQNFIEDIDRLSDEEIRKKYKVQLDGKELTETELKGIMAYVRSLRSMEE
jgi:transcriptional regulator with XRE-family HTH domain